MTKRLEMLIVAGILATIWIGITNFLNIKYHVSAGDAAAMVDLIKSVAAGKGLVNPTISAANDLWPLFGASAEKYCGWDFTPQFRDANDLTWHAYWLTFPIAALTLIPGIGALGLAVALVALSHVGALGLIWWYLRRWNVPVLAIIAMCVAVFVFKPWSESLIGQIYFDRLFILPGMALVFLVHMRLTAKGPSLVWLTALTLLCVLISERPALMVGGFLIGYPVLRKGWNAFRLRDERWLMALGLLCIVYVLIYTKFVQQSPYLSAWTNVSGMVQVVLAAILPGGYLFPQTMKLFAVLAPFIILAAFEWRMALIAIGAVVPNVLVSIGGAEKYVFATHYHMPYVPFVLAAATIGLARLWQLIRQRRGLQSDAARATRSIPAAALTVVVALVAAYSNWFNQTDLSRTFVFNNPVDPGLARAIVPGMTNIYTAGPRAMQTFTRELVSVIPRGSEVSSPEFLWPALVDRGGMTIDFMPFGVGIDQYVVMVSAKMPDDSYQLSVPSFQTKTEIATIRKCVQERVDRQYEVIKQEDWGACGIKSMGGVPAL